MKKSYIKKIGIDTCLNESEVQENKKKCKNSFKNLLTSNENRL